jgi:hypothetical protein
MLLGGSECVTIREKLSRGMEHTWPSQGRSPNTLSPGWNLKPGGEETTVPAMSKEGTRGLVLVLVPIFHCVKCCETSD